MSASQTQSRTTKSATKGATRKTATRKSPAKSTSKATSAKKTAMGPSGYRIKFGSSDQIVMDAVRATWPQITFGDDDILQNVGWAITPKTAVAKMRTLIES